MTKHTPGPWQVDARLMIMDPADDGYVATVGTGYADSGANARLIAAAPELLEALKGILEIGKRDTTNPKYDGYYRTAREAIAKAEGDND